MTQVKIFIASDHGGFNLKTHLIEFLKKEGILNILDFGIHSQESCNYNEIAQKMLEEMQKSSEIFFEDINNFGILVCGSGTGMSMFANRFKNIRACNAISVEQLKLARRHNNSNIICFGERLIDFTQAEEMLKVFIGEKFEKGRHLSRLVFDAKKCLNLNYNKELPNEFYEIKTEIKYYSNNEIKLILKEPIIDEEVTIFQSFTDNFNNDIMLLQTALDILKKNKVKIIKYLAPFLPYTRQENDDRNYSCGSKIFAEILNFYQVSEVATFDLHSLTFEKFFKGKVNNLSKIPSFIEHIKKNHKNEEVTIAFPDEGAFARFSKFFKKEDFNLAIFQKKRQKNEVGQEIFLKLLNEIKTKKVIIIDDIIDTGETISKVNKILKESGVKEIYLYAVHFIFSESTFKKLESLNLSQFYVSSIIGSEELILSKNIQKI